MEVIANSVSELRHVQGLLRAIRVAHNLHQRMEPSHVRTQLDRILTSTVFNDAGRASGFLRFIVERVLDGRSSEIKESVIAVEVLGRHSSFDSKTDPIVRVEARRLRDRLSSYYASEGRSDTVLISVPKGTYVPVFSEQQTPDQPRTKLRGFRWQLAGWALFALAALTAAFLHARKGLEGGMAQLSILPPNGTSFGAFAISPDGRNLAFTAERNGHLMLWTRRLDSLNPKVFSGTDLAAYPFWSPDSRSVAFFTPSKLKVIDIAGGPPRDIANAVLGYGGTWNRRGTIVFCPRPLGVLYEVLVSGGPAKPVTSLDTARGEVAHRFPVFLPDGRHFLYLAASSRPGESAIRLASLDSSGSTVLLSADTSAGYGTIRRGRPGSLLFVAGDGSLISQHLDLGQGTLTGERDVVVPEIRHRRWLPASFSVSDDGILLYQDGSADDQQLAWFDRQGKLIQTVGPPNSYMGFSLSPDETRLAILRHDDPDTVLNSIWVMDLSREGALSRMSDTAVAEPEFSPIWSPGSHELLFSRGDDRRMRLLIQMPNRRDGRTILDTEGPKFPSDWSSDGQFVTFSSQWPDYRNLHTWTIALDESSETMRPRAFLQHSYSEFSATFSPVQRGKAARWIAYTSDETGRPEVYVRDFPSGTQKWQVSTGGGGLPRWNLNGRELFYLALDGTLMAVPVDTRKTFASGTPQALFASGVRPDPTSTFMNQYAVSRTANVFC